MRYNAIDNLYQKLISDQSNKNNLKTLITYEDKMRINESCDYMASFYDENKELDISTFTWLINFDAPGTAEKCKQIGKGYNAKGYDAAKHSLMNYITNSYNDFNKLEERNKSYIASLFTEDNLQINTNRILELLFFNYEICLIKDYNSKKKTLKCYDYIYIGIIIVVFIGIAAVYIDKMVLFYWKVDKTNSEMKKLLYNTIIY